MVTIITRRSYDAMQHPWRGNTREPVDSLNVDASSMTPAFGTGLNRRKGKFRAPNQSPWILARLDKGGRKPTRQSSPGQKVILPERRSRLPPEASFPPVR
jgi:hypothetical protein